jgi:hypothetical protein
MDHGLQSTDLPRFFYDAERVAVSAQTAFLRYSAVRLIAAVAAAIGGALWLSDPPRMWFGLVSLVGFIVALVVEVLMALQQPERDWHTGRALAESAKTLAWRYAVHGSPFAAMTAEAARKLLRDQLVQHEQPSSSVGTRHDPGGTGDGLDCGVPA